MVSLRTATEADLPAVLGLLEAAHLPQAGVAEHIQNFVVALEDEKLVGCAGLEIHGEAGLLRSVAVDQQYRSQGIGAKLTAEVLERAEGRGVSSVSLLTTTAQDYFPRLGFIRVKRCELPSVLAQSEELKGACPDTAITLLKR